MYSTIEAVTDAINKWTSASEAKLELTQKSNYFRSRICILNDVFVYILSEENLEKFLEIAFKWMKSQIRLQEECDPIVQRPSKCVITVVPIWQLIIWTKEERSGGTVDWPPQTPDYQIDCTIARQTHKRNFYFMYVKILPTLPVTYH